MCHNIKQLRRTESSPTDAELHNAALQFVRKISGCHAGRALFQSLPFPAESPTGVAAYHGTRR